MRRILALAAIAGLSMTANAATFVIEDFDGGSDTRVTGATVSPDNSGNTGFNGAPGVFPGSNFDVFGRTNRGVGFDFADDSATGIGNPGEFPGDTFGIVPFGGPNGKDANDFFFGVNDLANGDNPSGGGTASWTVDITGLTNLSLSTVFSAMGDFEAGDNIHTFTASIDNGPAQTLFVAEADNNLSFTYTLEGGATRSENDPMVLTDDNGSTIIDNTFSTTGVGAISGTGSSLVITYTAGVNNGGSEPFAFDDIILTADMTSTPVVPEPGTALVFAGLAAAAVLGGRRNEG